MGLGQMKNGSKVRFDPSVTSESKPDSCMSHESQWRVKSYFWSIFHLTQTHFCSPLLENGSKLVFCNSGSMTEHVEHFRLSEILRNPALLMSLTWFFGTASKWFTFLIFLISSKITKSSFWKIIWLCSSGETILQNVQWLDSNFIPIF